MDEIMIINFISQDSSVNVCIKYLTTYVFAEVEK